MFANGSGDWSSISCRFIPKTQQYLILPFLTLSIIKYISRVKWSNPGKGVVLFPTSRCCSYWKGSLRVAFDYGCQLYLYLEALMVQSMSSYEMKSVTCVQILSEVFCISLIGKDMNSAILPPAMGKIVGQTELFNLWQPRRRKTLNSQTC